MSVYSQGFADERRIKLTKTSGAKDVTDKGAFAKNTKIDISLEIPRSLGISGVFVRLEDDETKRIREIPFEFDSLSGASDKYNVTLDFSALCGEYDDGLFFWNIKFLKYEKTLYTASINNVDFRLTEKNEEAKPFRILVYKDDFDTPDWAKKGVMYQIFVDRFSKGKAEIPVREDAVVIDDWYDGIPEYPEKSGDPLKNNSFFGGNLYGVCEKLDYLEALGIDILYFCPVFKAYSNHKYDTGDYETVDEMFGGDKAFDELVKQAKKRGMRIILDGVFNHTGDDSKYFNRYGKYDSVGAYQSKDSKYFDWYNFENHPDKYEAWWGIEILPRINGDNKSVRDYFLSENGIIRKWIRRGIDGWRLDVADELSEGFLEELTKAAKTEKSDSLVIGEVWENAADKISYGKRRKYFRGNQLDSVMNYPVKYAIIDFVKYADAERFRNSVTEIYSSYPSCCSDVLMNLVGSHDTERILTILGGESPEGKTNKELSTKRMTSEQFSDGIEKLKIASVIQFTLPGIPMIYYGDEAGMEGYHDPFCRRPFPWGKENDELLCHYKALCRIKKNNADLQGASLKFRCAYDGFAVYSRGDITVLVNVSPDEKKYALSGKYTDLMTGETGKNEVVLSPMSSKIVKK